MSINNSGSDRYLGILVVASLFGLVGAVMSYVMWEFGVPSAIVIGILITLIAMVIMWFAWREPLPPLGAEQPGAYKPGSVKAPTVDSEQYRSSAAENAASSGSSAGSATSTGSASGTGEGTASGAAATGAVASQTLLKGEEELASTKGEWKYDGAAAAKPDEKPNAEPEAKPEPKAQAPAAADTSGDDIAPGTQPEKLSGARDGKADNLKEIKGVGPKLEKLLNSLGIFHFDQIAGWSGDELAWIDQNIEGFKGRASRDEWVAQAKILAAGGETEFSQRVDDGDVY